MTDVLLKGGKLYIETFIEGMWCEEEKGEDSHIQGKRLGTDPSLIIFRKSQPR